MSQANSGDRVTVHFIGRLDDGTIFETSEDCSEDDCGCSPEEECSQDHDDCGCEPGPLEFTIGGGEVFEAIEKAVIGMQPGERRTVRLEPSDAYGERNEELVFDVPRSELPPGMDPGIGEMLEFADSDDEEDEGFPVWVTEIKEDSLVLDGNHPLAGQALTFEIELVEVAKPH